MTTSGSGLPRDVLIDVPVDGLPPVLRARLVPGSAIVATDRFRRAPRPSVLGPLTGALLFASVGIAALAATLRTGFDPDAGDSRFVYAGLAGAFLLAAAFASRSMVHAWRHRGDSSRMGCHVIAREGVLIAERGRCTWVPRDRLAAPVDDPSTDTRLGGGGALFLVSDGGGGIKRWSVPRRVGSELDLWRREGVLPDWMP